MKVLIALACVAVASALPPVEPQTPDIRPVFVPPEVLDAVPEAVKVVASPAAPAPLSEADDRTVENAQGPQKPDIKPEFVPYKVRVEDSPPTPEVDAVRVVDASLDEAVDPVNVVDAPVYEPISRSELETLVFMLQDAPEKVVVIDHYPQIPLLPPRGVPPYHFPPYYQNPLWR